MPLSSWFVPVIGLFIISVVRAEDEPLFAIVDIGDTWEHVITRNCSISCFVIDTRRDFKCAHRYTHNGLNVEQLYNGSWLLTFRPYSLDNAHEFCVRCGSDVLSCFYFIPKSQVNCTADACYFEFFSKPIFLGVSAHVNGSSILYSQSVVRPNVSQVSWPVAGESPTINVYDKSEGKKLHEISIQLPIHKSKAPDFTLERATAPTTIASTAKLSSESDVFDNTKSNIPTESEPTYQSDTVGHIIVVTIVLIFIAVLVCLIVIGQVNRPKNCPNTMKEGERMLREEESDVALVTSLTTDLHEPGSTVGGIVTSRGASSTIFATGGMTSENKGEMTNDMSGAEPKTITDGGKRAEEISDEFSTATDQGNVSAVAGRRSAEDHGRPTRDVSKSNESKSESSTATHGLRQSQSHSAHGDECKTGEKLMVTTDATKNSFTTNNISKSQSSSSMSCDSASSRPTVQETVKLADVKNNKETFSVGSGYESVIGNAPVKPVPGHSGDVQNVTFPDLADRMHGREPGDRNEQDIKQDTEDVNNDSGHVEETNNPQDEDRQEEIRNNASFVEGTVSKSVAMTSDEKYKQPDDVLNSASIKLDYTDELKNPGSIQVDESRSVAREDQLDGKDVAETSSGTTECMKPAKHGTSSASGKTGDHSQMHQNKSEVSYQPIQTEDAGDEVGINSQIPDTFLPAPDNILSKLGSETREIVDIHQELRKTLIKVENCMRDPVPSSVTDFEGRSDALQKQLLEAQSQVCKIMQVLPEIRKLIRDAQELETVQEALSKCQHMYDIYKTLIDLLTLSASKISNDAQIRGELKCALNIIDDFVSSISNIEQMLLTLKNQFFSNSSLPANKI